LSLGKKLLYNYQSQEHCLQHQEDGAATVNTRLARCLMCSRNQVK